MDDLKHRTGLPEQLQVLLERYPRSDWEYHRNFDELTRFWLDRHLMFRDVLGKLRMSSEAYLSRGIDARAFASGSRHLTGFFLSQLRGHHQIEDEHYFPILGAFDARLDRGFELLDNDHKELDSHIYRLAEATNYMLLSLHGGQGDAGVAKVHGQLEVFGRFMHRHLTDEEELVVPTILEYGPVKIN